MDIPTSAFIGGLFGASILGLMDTESEVPTRIPFISAISIRFDPDDSLFKETMKETIQENFLKEVNDFTVTYNSDQFEIKVLKPRKILAGDETILILHGCKYDEFKNDAFLTVAIRSGAGIPDTANITLLRHFIKKLQDKKIKYEIW